MENVYNSLEEVIDAIVHSKEYQNCLDYKEKMKDNEEIMNLIELVKKTQKEYIRSYYDPSIKEKLDQYNQILNEIPLYHYYQESLEQVNWMIGYVKDTFNDYFQKVLNS